MAGLRHKAVRRARLALALAVVGAALWLPAPASAAPGFTLSAPSGTDFGAVTVGVESAFLPVDITNTGDETLAIGVPRSALVPIVRGPDTYISVTEVQSVCADARLYATTVFPGETVQVDMCMLAIEVGPRSVTVPFVLTPSGGSPLTETLTFSSTAAAGPTEAAEPSSLVFPPTVLGQSVTRTITVTNPGPGLSRQWGLRLGPGLLLEGVSCVGRVSPFVPVLTPGGSCTFSLSWTPTTMAPLAAVLDLADSSPAGLVHVGISGTPVSPLVVEPSPVEFGPVPVGGSTVRTVTIRNTGLSTLSSLTWQVTDAAPAAFAATGTGTCVSGASLAPGASCTVDVSFAPTSADFRTAGFGANALRGGDTSVGAGAPLNGQGTPGGGGGGDTTAPVLGVPATTHVRATGPGGAVVTYTASALDDVDGPITPACAPPSGTLFPVGETLVTCTAEDLAGNPASASFTVVVAPGNAQLVTGLALSEERTTTSQTAPFTWTTTPPNRRTECSLDAAPWQACSSPRTYHGLAAGTHTLCVRALVGGTPEPSPACATWTIVGAGPPEVTIGSAPADGTARTALFSFGSSQGGVRFECSLDGSAFRPCSPPYLLRGLARGTHTLQVRARNFAGQTGPPATHTWTIS